MDGGAVGHSFEMGLILIKITFKSSSLKPLNQIKPNLAGIVLG
jgi:hypothetical protein